MELNSQSLACRYISSIIWFLSFHSVEIYLADSYLGLKSKMSVYRGGKKKQTAFHLKLSSGETLDCCPFTLLPWWRQFIASTGETSVYRSLLLRALGASWASLCCEERRPPARRSRTKETLKCLVSLPFVPRSGTVSGWGLNCAPQLLARPRSRRSRREEGWAARGWGCWGNTCCTSGIRGVFLKETCPAWEIWLDFMCLSLGNCGGTH